MALDVFLQELLDHRRKADMSEYQYYEWQTIDRPLTAEEQAAVNKLSSHIDVTSTRAIVTYNWGDFKHKPKQVLERYFDAFLYYANWGSRQLAFRFPKGLLDEGVLQPYLLKYGATLETVSEYQILYISFLDEDGGHWYNEEANLSSLAPLRDSILAGDYRVLYLASLMAASANRIDEELEPPVPPGLQTLTGPLAEFCRFFQLDPFLVQTAAQASEPLRAAPAIALDAAIALLPRAECDDFLQRLAEGEPLLSLKLNRRLQELAGAPDKSATSPPRRRWCDLRETAETMRQAEAQRQSVEAEARRIRDLQDFAAHSAQAWHDVVALTEQKQSRPYDEAVALLGKLRDLAEFQDDLPAFQTKLASLRAQYARRPGLQDRLRKAGLA